VSARRATLVLGLLCAACLPDPLNQPVTIEGGEGEGEGEGGSSVQIVDELDKLRAQETFPSSTELMRHVIAPTCAAQNNECHNNEDFPDMSTEGNLWNLRDLRCNLGVGERDTIEDYCEAKADELRIGTIVLRIGSIAVVNDVDGDFDYYEIRAEQMLPQAMSDASFVIERDGQAMPQLGGGGSLAGESGSNLIRVTDVDDIPDPLVVSQGDENGNGVFGDGTGTIVKSGSARDSYLVWRLLAEQTQRVRMPLNENADNPTEVNGVLSLDAMYALMSWINCMQPSDSVYAAIGYDCPANADNEGTW
jgi:hypothetical protein